jgi:hypothetical protein
MGWDLKSTRGSTLGSTTGARDEQIMTAMTITDYLINAVFVLVVVRQAREVSGRRVHGASLREGFRQKRAMTALRRPDFSSTRVADQFRLHALRLGQDSLVLCGNREQVSAITRKYSK